MTDSNRDDDTPLHLRPEWCRATLASVGDAVITTDMDGVVTFLNGVAESLTGWSQREALGVPLEAVFNIINQDTRPTVERPTVRAVRDGVIVGGAEHTVLIAKDGTERPMDRTEAPIWNGQHAMTGVVLVVRDISERDQKAHVLVADANCVANIIATSGAPFLVLDRLLRVRTANPAFYDTFHTEPSTTENWCM